MSNPPVFSLDDYVANAHQTAATVQIPHGGWFRVHPDKERVAGPFFVARYEEQWWLVHPDVIASGIRISVLWRADLYEAMYEDGRVIVIPVTYPLPGKEGWFNTLTEAVKQARKQWVSIESDRDQGCYQVHTEPKKKRADADWLGCDFGDLVEHAFADRIITTCEQARKKWPQFSSKRTVTEAYED